LHRGCNASRLSDSAQASGLLSDAQHVSGEIVSKKLSYGDWIPFMSGKVMAAQQWEFLQDEQGKWYWRCISEPISAESDLRFESRTDCIADAMRHGYLSGTGGCDPVTSVSMGQDIA
jgi:hypothetical protein